jgi:hypothetical protein
MPVPLSCPGCGARLTAPESAAGQSVTCPKCQTAIAVPAADYEVVDAPPPARPVRAVPARPVAARPVDEDDSRRFKRRRVDGDDDEDDRPRKKPARAAYDDEDDDEGDYAPRKKPRKNKGVPVWVFAAIGGGVLFLIAAAVGGYLLLGGKSGGLPLGGVLDSPPAGYSTARDSDGGFRVFLPGMAKKAEVTVNGQKVDSRTKAVWASMGSNGDSQAWVTSMPLPANFNPGTSPEQLEQLLKMTEGGFDAPWNVIAGKTPKTLDGKPALEVRHWYNGNWVGQDKGKPQTPDPNSNQTVLCVTHDGKRVYVIKLERKGRMPDDETVKTVYESFKFI